MKTARTIVTCSLALMLAACSSQKDASKSNFSKTIQSYLDKQNGLCAAIPASELPFTLNNKDFFGVGLNKQANALADAGLLTKRDTEVKTVFGNSTEPATEYQLSDIGKKYLITKDAKISGKLNAFCTGKYVVVDVDNFTEPSEMAGMKISRVNFRYRLKDPADWASSEGLLATYNNFAGEHKGDEVQGKAVLILTNEGWIHEGLFKK